MYAKQTLAIVKKFVSAGGKGNIKLEEAEKMDFQLVLAEIEHLNEAAFVEFMGNAHIVKDDKSASPLQRAAIACLADLKMWQEILTDKSLMITKCGQYSYKYPTAWKSFVPDLQCYFWNETAKKIETVPLTKVIIDTPMYMERLLVFIGPSKRGKSKLAASIGCMLAEAHGYDRICEMKKLDPAGELTKSGGTERCGAFIMHDTELVSRRNDELTAEEKKGLFKVEENWQYGCRYGDALLPALVPRMLTCNPGKENGKVTYDDWFIRNGLHAVGMLVRQERDKIIELDDNAMAMVNHVVIIKVDDFLYENKPQGDQSDEKWKRFNSRRAV